jgi:hypothetical protein
LVRRLQIASEVFSAVQQFKELIMSIKNMLTANMATALGIAFGIGLACLSPSSFAVPRDTVAANSQASVAQRGVVLLVHPQKSTAAFLSILDLPVPLSDNGRFAVLTLGGAENKAARYALVYVPQGIEVKPRDVVSLEAGVSDLARPPAHATVAMIVSKGANLSSKAFGGEVSNVVFVTPKNGSPELWIEDQHTGVMQIFAAGQGDLRVQ